MVLANRWPPDYGGGAQQMLALCCKLAQYGIEISVLAGYKGQRVITEEVKGIPVTRLPLRPLIMFYARLLQHLLMDRYDLIHAQAAHHHAYGGILAGRLLGKPIVIRLACLGGDDPTAILQRRLGSLQLAILRWGTMLITTSREMTQATLDSGWPADRVAHIPNGVDVTHFYPLPGPRRALRLRLGLPPYAFIITFIGSLSRRKGVDVLLHAWPAVKRARPNARLVLIGPGKDVNVPSWPDIMVVGQVDDVRPYLQASDLFILPSRQEGMPNALLEAMACGLPFVATQLGCIEEISPRGQHAHLVSVPAEPASEGDVANLAEAMMDLIGNDQARQQLGAAARRQVETHISLDIAADHYITLYHQLLR